MPKLTGYRTLSSAKIAEITELIARKILDTYLEPDKGSLSTARSKPCEFSEACCAEFEMLRTA